jgi:hypothetical protein
MKKELLNAFNERVERYRKSLLYCAKLCDWNAFEKKAAELFDYVEGVEMTEVERRFDRIFMVVLALVAIAVFALLKVDTYQAPELLRKILILTALGGGGFEFFFLVNFRHYMKYKKLFYRNRRDSFIRNIEDDFRSGCIPVA